jgi:hypothetical protein
MQWWQLMATLTVSGADIASMLSTVVHPEQQQLNLATSIAAKIGKRCELQTRSLCYKSLLVMALPHTSQCKDVSHPYSGFRSPADCAGVFAV